MSDLFEIIHEDSDVLVVNKPAGLVCHPTKTDERSSLIGRVRLHLGHGEGRLVNRLDRETSGLVLVAKSMEAAGELGRLIEAKTIRKEYQAIVYGSFPCQTLLQVQQSLAQATEGDLIIEAPLGKDERSTVVIKDCVRPDGAAARTHLRVLKRFAWRGDDFTLLHIRPHSGRKHQIRIHLAHIGHPIVGDKIYGVDEQIYLRFVIGALTESDRTQLILSNHALHAGRLEFRWRNRDWKFSAKPDEEFCNFAGMERTAC